MKKKVFFWKKFYGAQSKREGERRTIDPAPKKIGDYRKRVRITKKLVLFTLNDTKRRKFLRGHTVHCNVVNSNLIVSFNSAGTAERPIPRTVSRKEKIKMALREISSPSIFRTNSGINEGIHDVLLLIRRGAVGTGGGGFASGGYTFLFAVTTEDAILSLPGEDTTTGAMGGYHSIAVLREPTETVQVLLGRSWRERRRKRRGGHGAKNIPTRNGATERKGGRRGRGGDVGRRRGRNRVRKTRIRSAILFPTPMRSAPSMAAEIHHFIIVIGEVQENGFLHFRGDAAIGGHAEEVSSDGVFIIVKGGDSDAEICSSHESSKRGEIMTEKSGGVHVEKKHVAARDQTTSLGPLRVQYNKLQVHEAL